MRLAIYFTSSNEVNKRRLSFEVNKNNPWARNIYMYLTEMQKM